MKKLHLEQSARAIEFFIYSDKENELLLDPPYQRGLVWGLERKRNLIYSLMRGIPIPSITINDRLKAEGWDFDANYSVIDGKQRISTILSFKNNEFTVPGVWFHPKWDEEIKFYWLNAAQKRCFKNKPLAVNVGTLTSLKEEKEVFNLINFGGVEQGESDLSDSTK